jgi:hypothetical protein
MLQERRATRLLSFGSTTETLLFSGFLGSTNRFT